MEFHLLILQQNNESVSSVILKSCDCHTSRILKCQ